MSWMLAAIFICGASAFTSCSNNDDNPQPWILSKGGQPVCLFSEEANEHLLAFSWWEDCVAEIEVHPEFLTEYLAAATEIQQKSLAEEPGVLCLFPNQMKVDSTQFRILEIYASQEAYQHHIQTAHFQKYKQGTLHMVKSLKLQDLTPLDRETMSKIFKKIK